MKKRKTTKRRVRRTLSGVAGVAGKRRRRRSTIAGVAGKRRTRRRYHGGKIGKGAIGKAVMAGATAAAGAIAASFAAGALPKVNPRIKPLIPIAIGALLSSTKLGKNELVKNAALGMIAIGAISALRQFMPKLPLLSGEEVYTPEEMALLGYPMDQSALDEGESMEMLGMSANMGGMSANMGGYDTSDL